MKFVKFSLIFSVLISLIASLKVDNHLARAISDFIGEFYVKSEIKFDIFFYGNDIDYLEDILAQIQPGNNQSYSYEVKIFRPPIITKVFTQSTVLIVEDLGILYHLSELAKVTNRFWKELKFLVILPLHKFFNQAETFFNSDIKSNDEIDDRLIDLRSCR